MATDGLTSISDAQRDMRHAYLGGGPGVLASALVWLGAGLAAQLRSPEAGMWTLLVGGMLIHPAGVGIARALGRPGVHSPGNPLGRLALEGTVLLLLCLPLAVVASRVRLEWFFPAVLLVIGGRYLTFSTIYGMRLYWGCGGALAAAGFALWALRAPPALGAFTGAALELAFAALITSTARREGLRPGP